MSVKLDNKQFKRKRRRRLKVGRNHRADSAVEHVELEDKIPLSKVSVKFDSTVRNPGPGLGHHGHRPSVEIGFDTIVISDSEPEHEYEDIKEEGGVVSDVMLDSEELDMQLAIRMSLDSQLQDGLSLRPFQIPDLTDDEMEVSQTPSKLPDLTDDEMEVSQTPFKSDTVEDAVVCSDISDVESVSGVSGVSDVSGVSGISDVSEKISVSGISDISEKISDKVTENISHEWGSVVEDCMICDAFEDDTSNQSDSCLFSPPPAKKPRLLRLIPPKPLIEDISEVIDLTGEYDLPDLDGDDDSPVDLTGNISKKKKVPTATLR